MRGVALDALDARGSVRVGGLGDSLTQGWGVRRSFFDLACDALARRHPEARVETRNAGVPGDTAAGGRERLPSLLAWRPDVVVVEFGLNDAFIGVHAASFARAVEAVGDAVVGADAAPLLVTACPVAVPEMNALAAPFWDALRDLAARRGWPLADLEAHWRRALSLGRVAPGLHQQDGVHPNQEGHALMAEGLARALDGE